MERTKVAILGSGNIASDLMVKIIRLSDVLELTAMAGIDPDSDGLARAKSLGVATTYQGLSGLLELEAFQGTRLVFDATSAAAHIRHNEILQANGINAIDLTPAAIGPYVVPTVNLEQLGAQQNLNMVTCGGQATIPIVFAISQVCEVIYGEIVASISSSSAGPGTRANIDEFTQTTARAIETIGGARKGKAIIILNPAEPPMIMRDTIFCLVESEQYQEISQAIEDMVERVQAFVPGFRLKQAVQFDSITTPIEVPGEGRFESGTKVSVFLEVEGAAHYLPSFAGNLDIMTSAALQTAESLVGQESGA